MSAERWLPIPGYPGYEASDFGRVRSLLRGRARILAHRFTSQGYVQYMLRDPLRPGHRRRQRRLRFAHQLVLESFVGPRPQGLITRHLNGSRDDNRLINLAYGTHAENAQDRVLHGRDYNQNKTHCAQGHAFSSANTAHHGRKRICRICRRRRVNETRARKRVAA